MAVLPQRVEQLLEALEKGFRQGEIWIDPLV
jgi:hypothetical protein